MTTVESKASVAAPAPQLARSQFTLRSMLILTTVAAVCLALVTAGGRDWAIVSGGLFLCAANYLGFLAFLQSRLLALAALGMASIAFFVSFLMKPHSMGDSGWEAAKLYVGAAGGCWGGLLELVMRPSHSFTASLGYTVNSLNYTLATLGNFAMALCPVMAYWLARDKARWHHAIMMACLPAVWMVPVFWELEALEIGYYVWCAAFTVLAIVVRVSLGELTTVLLVTTSTTGIIWILRAITGIWL